MEMEVGIGRKYMKGCVERHAQSGVEHKSTSASAIPTSLFSRI